MFFEKKLVMLSGRDGGRGSIRLVKRDGKITATVSASGLEADEYSLSVSGGGACKSYPLGRMDGEKSVELSGETDTDRAHFAVCGRNGAVLYGTLNKRRLWWGNLPEGRAEEGEKTDENSDKAADEAPIAELRSVVPDIFPSGEGYDDNAVATVNYYDAAAEVRAEAVAREESTEVRGRSATFYEQVGEQIEQLMREGERIADMESRLPHTRWVKINYGGGRHYVVGVVGEPPKYVCYGVPGSYSAAAPSVLGEACLFLPKSEVRPQGEGYWLMYQSADTGETVLPAK